MICAQSLLSSEPRSYVPAARRHCITGSGYCTLLFHLKCIVCDPVCATKHLANVGAVPLNNNCIHLSLFKHGGTCRTTSVVLRQPAYTASSVDHSQVRTWISRIRDSWRKRDVQHLTRGIHLFSLELSVGCQSGTVTVGKIVDDQRQHDGLSGFLGLAAGCAHVAVQAVAPPVPIATFDGGDSVEPHSCGRLPNHPHLLSCHAPPPHPADRKHHRCYNRSHYHASSPRALSSPFTQFTKPSQHSPVPRDNIHTRISGSPHRVRIKFSRFPCR